MHAARQRIEEAMFDDKTEAMLLEIRKPVVEETVVMNPAFDYDGLDEEVAHALIAIWREAPRAPHRYARGMAGRFIGSGSPPGNKSREIPTLSLKAKRGVTILMVRVWWPRFSAWPRISRNLLQAALGRDAVAYFFGDFNETRRRK